VVLVDALPVLGGQTVNSLIGLFCGVFGNAPEHRRLTHAIFDDIFRDLEDASPAWGAGLPCRLPEREIYGSQQLVVENLDYVWETFGPRPRPLRPTALDDAARRAQPGRRGPLRRRGRRRALEHPRDGSLRGDGRAGAAHALALAGGLSHNLDG
jgi:hypothetical protein